MNWYILPSFSDDSLRNNPQYPYQAQATGIDNRIQLFQQWKAYYEASGYDSVTAHNYAQSVVYAPAAAPRQSIPIGPRPTAQAPPQPPPTVVHTTISTATQAAKPAMKPISYANAVKKTNALDQKPLYKQVKSPSKPAAVFKEEVEKPQTSTAESKYPDAFVKYLERVFESCPSPAQRAKMEEKLKDLVTRIQAQNAMWTTDWASMPIPTLGEKKQPPAAPQSISKKPSLSLETDSQTSSNPLVNPFSYTNEEAERREKRAKRFNEAQEERKRLQKQNERINSKAKEEFLAGGADGNPDIIDWDEHTIVGTSQALEKRYLRLTSAPDPYLVRPLPVLRKALDFLIQKWKDEGNYTYICDQFKSMRQDLTVQRIKNTFTVQVYEIHARIALEKGDIGEYNQCQAQLKQLYEFGLAGNQEEFLGYRILYMVYTFNRQDLLRTITQLTSSQKVHPNISHALQVRACAGQGDFYRFFQLYYHAPDMSSYLMDKFLERERLKALNTICRAFRPSVSLSYVAKTLGFVHPKTYEKEGENERILDVKKYKRGRKLCLKWLESENVVWVDGEKETIDTKLSMPVFMRRVTEALKKVDIKGQIH